MHAQGLCGEALWRVTRANIISRLTYASSAWWGFCNAGERSQLEELVTRLVKKKYLPPDQSTLSEIVASRYTPQIVRNPTRRSHWSYKISEEEIFAPRSVNSCSLRNCGYCRYTPQIVRNPYHVLRSTYPTIKISSIQPSKSHNPRHLCFYCKNLKLLFVHSLLEIVQELMDWCLAMNLMFCIHFRFRIRKLDYILAHVQMLCYLHTFATCQNQYSTQRYANSKA